ncbi:MAG TPA: hypothetical protein VJN18_11115 [Polyangiaceae bacterium]|nr:hypothetical protein [Polyangiaceae bacterium]
MDPGDLTPFGLTVEFLDDGRALLRIGATLIALSPKQVAELRTQLGVGHVQVVNDTPFPLHWKLRQSDTPRPGGKNYTITISTGPRDDPPRPRPFLVPDVKTVHLEAEIVPMNRAPKPRKKREKEP